MKIEYAESFIRTSNQLSVNTCWALAFNVDLIWKKNCHVVLNFFILVTWNIQLYKLTSSFELKFTRRRFSLWSHSFLQIIHEYEYLYVPIQINNQTKKKNPFSEWMDSVLNGKWMIILKRISAQLSELLPRQLVPKTAASVTSIQMIHFLSRVSKPLN